MARGNKRSGRSQSKRQWDARQSYDEEETVDDLAHAATFAMMGPPAAVEAKEETKEMDDNEIDMEDADEDGNEDGDEADNEEGNDKVQEAKDESDDESEVDLGQDIATMDQVDDLDDEDDYETLQGMITEGTAESTHLGTAQPPKTEHEVDAYHTPIPELERHLQLQLTVKDDEVLAPPKASADSFKHLVLAGHVQHYLADDRTVVVQSSTNSDGDQFPRAEPLDEGSLLVIRRPTSTTSSPSPTVVQNGQLIPLGRIFEVFGPVSKPLYTIRLPPPTRPPSSASKQEKQPESTSKEFTSSDENIKEPPSSPGTEDLSTANSNAVSQEKGKTESTEGNSQQIATMPRSGKKAEPAPPPISDPWAVDGEYAQLLSKATISSIAVYYLQDEAKLIDTSVVMKNSGKGCDASNLYDEEVVNANEAYYSDDEKERQAKSRRKQSKGAGQPNARNHSSAEGGGSGHVIPPGFHSAVPQPSSRPLPQGFHNPTQQPPQQSNLPRGFHPPPPASYSQRPQPPGNLPPPPPPPAGGSAPPAYQY